MTKLSDITQSLLFYKFKALTYPNSFLSNKLCNTYNLKDQNNICFSNKEIIGHLHEQPK